MATPNEQIIIELVVRVGHPALLDGLDAWLQLGLISDDFVQRLCQRELICPLPTPLIAEEADLEEAELSLSRQPIEAGTFRPVGADDFTQQERSLRRATPTRSPNLVSQALQAFMAEISVVWLLFLGVFLVVVSSGVLAATQWRNVPPEGQYSILLGYTLVFCIASVWTARQPTLHLTSRMLTIATLLIVPVNFWMIDGFRLWNSAIGVGIATIAALILTGITILLLKPGSSVLRIMTAIVLGWLNLGWSQAGIPFAVAYTGTVGAAAVLLRDDQRTVDNESSLELELSTVAIAFSVLLLLGRAVLVAQVPLNQLALAIGLCGWLLGWLSRHTPTRMGWSWVGAGLLVVAWLAAIPVNPPWQAFLISGLALWLLLDALQRTSRTVFLSLGFLVGLQMVWLLWQLFPVIWQEQIMAVGFRLAGNEAMPFALMGLGYFPYVVLMVGFAFQLRRWQRPVLATHAEVLALALGGLLTVISVGNPLVRSLNLTLSTLTLGAVIANRARPSGSLVYLTHTIALATLFSWINRLAPTLGVISWTIVLLVVITFEWSLCGIFWRAEPLASETASPPTRVVSDADGSNQAQTASVELRQAGWLRSAWQLGLLLAGISYVLLWQFPTATDQSWKLAWLVVPVMLTGLNYRDRFPQSARAGWWSTFALVVLQFVTLGFENDRLFSLGAATLLMLLNTRRLSYLPSTLLTVGFGLAFWGAILWQTLSSSLESLWILPLFALTLVGLWGVRGVLHSRRGDLARFYRFAIDAWAIAVLLLVFLIFTALQGAIYFKWEPSSSQFVWACSVLVGAIAYRNWQSASNGGWWALAWSIELLTASSLSLAGRSLNDLAIANLVLGLVSQLLGDGWMVRTGSSRELSAANPVPARFPWSWHGIPLLYAVLGVVVYHASFTATTGLSTLVGALVGLGVGRRHPGLKPLSYFALLTASFAANELLFYQLSQAQGGSPGDGVVAFATLAIVLAILYRLLPRSLVAYLHLSPVELQSIGHVHWGLGYLFLAISLTLPRSLGGQWGWTAIAALLALYASGSGNQRLTVHPNSGATSSAWTYAGIVGVLIAITAFLHLLLPDAQLIDWAGTIASILAIFFYFGSWSRWGWPQTPWERSATVLPVLAVLLIGWGANIQSLLVTASFYAWLGSARRQIRFSYVSVLLADWAIIRLLHTYQLKENLWYAVILGGSLLYLAQVDPIFQDQQNREQRHWLRCLATGLVCLAVFYQSQVGITGFAPVTVGFLAIAIEFGFILVGLLQKVRAFLYIGTLTFMIQILWQLWRFISDYSLLLWTLGIILGLLLIWIAATFEARRAQMNTLLQHWITELDRWA